MSDRRVDVFFYGLFMDVEILRQNGVAPVDPRRAYVEDFAVRIGRRATLVPDAGGRVYGMLVALTPAELERLYAAPGLEGYRPEAVLARPLDGPPAPALCYNNLRDAPRPDERNPEYAARLQRVLGTLGFPPAYVASITPTSVDSGRRDMEYRTLGRTGLRVSALGFGCGNVGGLMVRGAPAERERAVARAIELGVNYFDTAPSYGDGLSEQHLGQALRSLEADVLVGTKVRLAPDELRDVRSAVPRALDASLRRLGRERVDLFQLHNLIGPRDAGDTAGADRVLDEVVPALEALKRAGKTRFYGITALGDAGALHRVVEAGVLDTAQV
ncbi:MAG: aldo/keto reductase, partial [Candidatus Rokuibacteriota bacterium]